jgi:hypothetical protein
MARHFVNSMANFVIHGGMVSFTLQDQAMRSEDGQPRPAEPETVADIVMREQDFATLVQFFNQHVAAFESHTGRKLGDTGAEGARPQRPQGGGTGSGGMKIRPRGG